MRRGFRKAPTLVWGLVVVVSLCGVLIAQTHLGTITGTVTDPNGALVTEAKVTVTNVATKIQMMTQTNDEGLFVVGSVPLGEYEIVVEKEGFRRTVLRQKVEVAQRVGIPISLEVGAVTETVEVKGGEAVAVNTVSGDIAREVTSSELENMPLLTRNPYVLLQLAPGAINTEVANGDTGGGASPIAVAGGRNRSINFLLDGTENNETFSTGPSTIVPVDAIQEFKVQANNMTAEFGRNAVQANVVTKSGSNSLHGSAFEFYRGAALSSQPVEEKAAGTPKSNYVRNVFGGSLGGPIIKEKTFFFGALEGTRVRSNAPSFFYVPTQEFLANSSANMASYINAGGGLPTPAFPNECITAADITAAEGVPALFAAGGGPQIPASTPLFCRTFVNAPIDAGGETAQNTWSITGRADHHFSQNTALTLRYAWYRQLFPVGAGSVSPYTAFNTDASLRSQNASIGLTHAFGPRLFNESRFTYSRTEPQAPLGAGDVNVQCLQYGLSGSLGTGDQMVFPGYLPSFCSGFAIPSGGPQNTYSGFTGFTYSKGRHTIKWGGYTRHLRDNHTFGAFANANSVTASFQNLLEGIVDSQFAVAFDPKGKVPGDLYDVTVDGPLVSPSFTRHYHYNEVAFYAEDQIKIHPRFTFTLGLRWEYLGVLHSPGAEKILDANLYLNQVNQALPKNALEEIRDARFQRGQNFFDQDWNNFGPRIGLAWDIFGKGRTVLRGGYGIFYDANFGNALFNAIQNPPNYAVLVAIVGVTPGVGTGPVQPNQFDTLQAMLGGGSFLVSSSARMLNKGMETAYTQQWNATVEHDILGKGVVASVSYLGAKGDKLYSLNNLNNAGSCIMLGAAHCAGSTLARLNQTGLSGMNRRANESFSRYHALNAELRTRQIGNSGLQFASTYTWAHAIDNATSFFADSVFDGNGNFGFSNPYDPAQDKANSSNDIRHRFTLNYAWEVPGLRNLSGAAGAIFGGWSLTGIFTAQTGGAFSVYEDPFGVFNDQCSRGGTNACFPVLTGSLPSQDGTTPSGDPNRFVLYDFSGALQSQADFCGGDLACSQNLYYFGQDVLLRRNTFRTPGYWNFDAAVLKDFKLPREGMKLQFRAEFFNIFNHSNLFADPNTNLLTSGQVLARRGVPPAHELAGTPAERRNIQLALRLNF